MTDGGEYCGGLGVRMREREREGVYPAPKLELPRVKGRLCDNTGQ